MPACSISSEVKFLFALAQLGAAVVRE